MLILAGLGLNDEKSLTLEEIDEVKNADKVYMENYTSIWFGNLENLKKIIGKEICLLGRKDLEEESYKIVEEAKEKNVIVFVPGDPLFATTHLSLISECLKKKVEYKILHNSSVISAIGETGIHFYKICKIITIPFKDRCNDFSSIKNYLKNREGHVVCLLDIDIERNRFLEVKDAVKFLIEIGALDENEEVVVASCLGTKKSKIFYGKAFKFLELNLDLPAVIIVLGKLHFSEKEYLENFKI
ncbi:MAG: diphthine synthase [Candidatus Aenigmatarchaeota archaeon]